MKLSQFTLMRGYQQAAQFGNPKFLDHFLDSEQGEQIRQDLKLKRIQFDTTPELAHKLENICNILECSKREFLEMVVAEAIETAEAQFGEAFYDAYGMGFVEAHENLQAMQKGD
jgi:DNA-binding Xre family transcriptional regulator